MTPIEHPGRAAECWFINAVHDRAVDVYADPAGRPAVTEVGPLECALALRVAGPARQAARARSLAVRWAEPPGGPVLAEASMQLKPGRSYAAVFHPGDVPGRYRLSVYRNDFRPAARACLEVRHVGFGPAIDWALAPRRGTDITIPSDHRRGRLLRGQWQQAREVIENDYRLEAGVQGRTTAVLGQLPLLHEVLTVAHYLGRAPAERRAHGGQAPTWLIQRLRVPAGPPDQPGVSHPAAPVSAASGDRRIIFCAPPLEVTHTDAVSTVIEARDPDGRIAGLAIDRIDPDPGGIALPATGVVPSPGIGAPALASLKVGAGVPEGRYQLHIRANPAEAEAEGATFSVPLTVRPVTPGRRQGT